MAQLFDDTTIREGIMSETPAFNAFLFPELDEADRSAAINSILNAFNGMNDESLNLAAKSLAAAYQALNSLPVLDNLKAQQFRVLTENNTLHFYVMLMQLYEDRFGVNVAQITGKLPGKRDDAPPVH